MAERYDFYVHDNRKITFNLTEPIMREDSGVTDFVFHIPKILNELEVSDWAWWLVFVNAKKEKYSIALTLSDDPESPLEKNVATYTVDYAMSIKAGSVQFALEAINAGTGGAIDNEWHTLTYETKVKETLQGNQAEYAETESDIISALIQEVRTKMNQIIGGATPTPVASVSQMTDTSKLYLLTTDGEWYYYNGTAWVSGGVYGARVVDSVPTQGSNNAVQSGGVYSALAGKVDAVSGKGLSANDYSDAEKAKVTNATADLSAMTTATDSDTGKALKAKTVSGGKVVEWEFGEAGGGDISALEQTVNEMNDFGTTSEDVDKTGDFVTGYYPADGAVGTTASTTLNTNSNYKGIYVPIKAGEQATVSANGNSHVTWAFTDMDFVILSKSGYEAYVDELLTASADGYLFVTTRYTYSYKLILHKSGTITLHDKMDEVDGNISALEAEVDETSASAGKKIPYPVDGSDAVVLPSKKSGILINPDGTAEYGSVGGASADGRNMVKIPNIVIDPMFTDLADTDAISITNAVCESDGDGVLRYSVANKTHTVLIKVADTESTDILFYSVKVAPVGHSVNAKPVTNSQTVVADGATQVVDGVITGGTGKVININYASSRTTMTNTVTMPIVVNLTAVFGAGHEPTYTEFKTILDNWDRDKFGEWISKQKYDAIIVYPKWYAQNLLVKTANSASIWNSDEKVVTGNGSADYIRSGNSGISNSDYSFDGDVIYLSAMVKASGNPAKFTLAHTNNAVWAETAIQNIPTADTWYHLSSIDRQISASVPDYRYVEVRAYYADATAQNGQTLTYKCGLALNLTTIFGKGNEPTDATVIDAMLSQYTDGWFAGSQNIWNPSIIKWLAESYKTFANGTYYGSDGKRFKAGSIIDRYDEQWSHAQSSYGLSATLVPVDNQFEGGIRTNGMVNVFPKYGRWERGAAGANTGSLFGGHVFEAWNNIRSYRLTMMMGHGGDEVSYTDENNVVHKTPREDEACIIVYSPANSYANPPVTPSEEQSKLRINKAQEDYYGDSSINMLGRIRIGGDTPTQGTVFTKNKMITYGRIILADTTQENKGKQLVFNNDGTITWTEVTLYQHPEPAPVDGE